MSFLSSRRWQAGAIIALTLVVLLALSSTILALAKSSPHAIHADNVNRTTSRLENFQHIFVIMMENISYTSLIGNSNAPWINFAAKNYGLAENYFGVAHPSQPNYIAATSGSTNGVVDDSNVTINVPNIVDQLEAHGKTWKAYMQSFSLCSTPLDSACGNQLYERKHDPFVSYTDVQSNPARMANIVGFSQFATDLANNKVPNYSWISPDQCNDMHGRSAPASDPCSSSNEPLLIQAGDTFLKNTVRKIMNSDAWQDSDSVIFITWDESDSPSNDTSGCCDANPGGGHVVTIAIPNQNDTARTSRVAYNHYSMLATIEDAWNLGCLKFTCDTTNVKPMIDLVGQNG